MPQVPNETYIYLFKADPVENNNKFYQMRANGDGNWTATYGREGATKPQTEIYPMSKWQSKYNEKLGPKKGYTDVTAFKSVAKVTEIKNSNGQLISKDPEVVSLIVELQKAANIVTKANYEVEAKSVTQAQIDAAQKQIDLLSGSIKHHGKTNWDINIFNKELVRLFIIIPRKMKKVADHMMPVDATKEQLKKLIETEQELLDSMASQVITNAATDNDSKDTSSTKTLLESLGLEMRVATKNEIEEVKKLHKTHSHKIKKVFAVTNKNTQKIFDENFNKEKNKEKQLFFHGSRNANFFFILQQGLKIRPSGAIHNGSLLGDAVYFADDDDKSMGYTDGGRWAGGSGNGSVYIAVFEVRIGKQLHMKDKTFQVNNSKKDLFDKGYDSVYAHKGANTGWMDLRKSEFTIYNPAQCTIKYLIEYKA